MEVEGFGWAPCEPKSGSHQDAEFASMQGVDLGQVMTSTRPSPSQPETQPPTHGHRLGSYLPPEQETRIRTPESEGVAQS